MLGAQGAVVGPLGPVQIALEVVQDAEIVTRPADRQGTGQPRHGGNFGGRQFWRAAILAGGE